MKAKYCIICGQPIKENNMYCSFCGTRAAEFTFEDKQEPNNSIQETTVLDDTHEESTEVLGNFKIPDFSPNTQTNQSRGSTIKERCPNCGAEISADDDYCAECGQRIVRNFNTNQNTETMETTVLNPIKMGVAASTFILSDRVPGAQQRKVTFCLNCGCRVPAGSDYCPECGTKVEQ